MELLQIKDLSFCYPTGERNAVDGVSLSIEEGSFTVVCGTSGCGKSTLLRLLKRELAPYGKRSGTVLYKGVAQEQLDPRTAAGEIGFVLQDPESQTVTDTVWHELAFGPESLGLDTAVIRRRVAEMASYFGIEGWFHRRTADLSGGQKQLLSLASVMAMHPEVLLLDEPTAQLDPIAAADFIGTLRKLNRELGLTVVLAEHRLEEVFPYADRVILMAEGRVVYNGVPCGAGPAFCTCGMEGALPAAMRIFTALGGEGDAPLTVREGRQLIRTYGKKTDTYPCDSSPARGERIAEWKEAWFRYERDGADVLKGLSLAVYRGEHFCILGGNGAGKSTALALLAGAERPYRGKVSVAGKAALLPQDPRTVFSEKTVEGDLREWGDETIVREIAQRLGITHLLGRHPYDLSGGEQQKAALAKLLAGNPQLLLLDEPTKGLDTAAKQVLADILAEWKKTGLAVVTVTHDVEFAAAYADRCALIFDGAAVSADAPNPFFGGNHFYTTAADRIARGHYRNAILCEQVAELCRLNGKEAL